MLLVSLPVRFATSELCVSSSTLLLRKLIDAIDDDTQGLGVYVTDLVDCRTVQDEGAVATHLHNPRSVHSAPAWWPIPRVNEKATFEFVRFPTQADRNCIQGGARRAVIPRSSDLFCDDAHDAEWLWGN
jgi:hypothetical protein